MAEQETKAGSIPWHHMTPGRWYGGPPETPCHHKWIIVDGDSREYCEHCHTKGRPVD